MYQKLIVLALIYLALSTGCSSEASGRLGSGTDSDNNDSSDSSTGDTDADSDADGDADGDADADADSDTDTTSDSAGPSEIPPNSSNNVYRTDYLTCDFRLIEEDATTFKGTITIGNANTDYAWNGYSFTAWSVKFLTTSTITMVGLDQWNPVKYTKEGDTLTIDLGDDKIYPAEFPQNTLVTIAVEGTKEGLFPFPARCQPDYIRGDIVYPVYPSLPRTWWKGKVHVTSADLIADEEAYYLETVKPITEGVFIYNPVHATQITIGQPVGVGRKINGFDNLHIRVPNKMMAMGVAFNYQWFKFNPNYFCALGTKEDYACGFVTMDDPQAGAGGMIVNLDGVDYKWYANFNDTPTSTPDGPFQQESPNFIALARIFPDYFTDENDHDAFVSVSSTPNDPQWGSAVITSALSNVSTRENLWALQTGDYGRIVFDAVDPMAELGVITYTYNRGIWGFCGTGLMGNMDQVVASDDVITDFGLTGMFEHVPQIRAIITAMNNETANVYDAELTFPEIEAFFNDVVRRFYARGYPNDAEWNAMLADVKTAFDVLAAHWGGDTVRYRYDLLTLLRVAEAHFKTPTIPRPTTEYWRFIAESIPC